MIAKQNFDIPQGADFLYTITLYNDDETPINLTGYTFRGQARKAYKSSKIEFSFVFALLNQLTDTGSFTMALPDTFYPGVMESELSFVYDVEMVSSSGVITRVISGTVTVIPEVTR